MDISRGYNDLLETQLKSYQLFFEIENLLRVAVYNMFLEKYGSGFFNEENIPPFQCDDVRVDTEFRIVQKANSKYGEHKKRIRNDNELYHPFWFIEYSELIAIISHYWEPLTIRIFKNAKGSFKDSLISALLSLFESRNAIAHNRYLKIYERDLLKRTFDLLIESIKNKYLEGYDILVLNEYDYLVGKVTNLNHSLKENLKKREPVSRLVIAKYLALTDQLIGLSRLNKTVLLLDDIIQGLKNYSKIPRMPGNEYRYNEWERNSGTITNIEQAIKAIKRG